jgi:hypothetical protein
MTSLKCALSTLCATFFLRSFLMLVLVIEIITPNHGKEEASIADEICITAFLLLGEILPIMTIFVYHY